MNLEELGAALRAERERRGLGIEDVANTLKIGARQLRALEEADLSSLPHVAYTRGFIRSYATFLGLSQAEIEEVLHCLAPQENIVASQAVYTPAEESGNASAGRLFSLVVVLIILVGGGYFLWNSGLAQKGMDMLRGSDTNTPQVARPSGLPEEAETPPADAAGTQESSRTQNEKPQSTAQTAALSAAPQSAAPAAPAPAAPAAPAHRPLPASRNDDPGKQKRALPPPQQQAPRLPLLPPLPPPRRPPPPNRRRPRTPPTACSPGNTRSSSSLPKNAGYTPAPIRRTFGNSRSARAIPLP